MASNLFLTSSVYGNREAGKKGCVEPFKGSNSAIRTMIAR